MNVRCCLRLTLSLASAGLLIALSGCSETTIPVPPEYEWFYELDDVARAAAVVGLEPEMQVDLCLLSRYVEHPASPAVCWAVAGEGAKVVPAISERLAMEEHPDLQLFNLLTG